MPQQRRSSRQEREVARLAKEANRLAAKQLRQDKRRDRRARQYDTAIPPQPTAQPAPWERQEDPVTTPGTPQDLRIGLVPVHQQSIPPNADADAFVQADPVDWAWVIISNASEGNWNNETPQWQAKAREWADTYCGEPFPAKEHDVAMGRALALITRVNPVQTGEWRAAAAVWCRRHDTDEHRGHMYPFTVVPLYTEWVSSTTRAPMITEGYL